MTIKPFAEQGHFTQMHNVLPDRVMPAISGSAWKVLCFVVRNTKGRQQSAESFSYPELMQGTGISSKETISKALKTLLSAELFGSPILLSRGAAERGVSTREATRYALNPSFQISLECASPKAIRSTKIEPSHGTEIEPRTKSRGTEIEPSHGTEIEPRNSETFIRRASAPAPTPKEITKKEVLSGGGGVSLGAGDTPPPPPLDPPSSPLLEALCEVCGLTPGHFAPRDQDELPRVTALVLSDCGEDESRAASEVRSRFEQGVSWKRDTSPRLSQVATEWRRQGQLVERQKATAAVPASPSPNASPAAPNSLEVKSNGSHRNGYGPAVPARVANDDAALGDFLARRGLRRPG